MTTTPDLDGLLIPSADGLIRLYPLVRGVVTDDGQLVVVCPDCRRHNQHGNALGHRHSHCSCRGQYVIIPEESESAPYGSQCRRCVSDFVTLDDDPVPAIRGLRLKAYTPADLDWDSKETVRAEYVCNFGHHWRRIWPETFQADVAPGQSRRCALYRHYDADGVLLYVGIADSPIARTKDHARSSSWVQFASRMEAVWMDSRTEAEAAEREAIARESPVFNIVHARNQAVRVARYLASKEVRN